MIRNILAMTAMALGLSACATVDVPSRNAPMGAAGLTLAEPAPIIRDYNVTDVRVDFRPNMRVSEANSYYPIADIVWRGDPLGDRQEQIAAIFTQAFTDGTAKLNGNRDVVVAITIQRFHSVTEKTRYSVGGVHDMDFTLAVIDAATGLVLEEPRLIKAELPALGGQAAIMADARGETQKVRILTYLSMLAGQELGPNTVAPSGV